MTLRYFLSSLMIANGYLLVKESNKLSNRKHLISKTTEFGLIFYYQIVFLFIHDIFYSYFELTIPEMYY